MNSPALALDFELIDTQGRTIRLSDFSGQKSVVLVLVRALT